MDAVYRAGRHAQAAAAAFGGNHGVHLLGGAHNGVDRAGADAGGAADAGGFVYPGQRGGLGVRRRQRCLGKQAGKVVHHFGTAGGAQVNCRTAFGQRPGIGQAARIAAFTALGLRQQVVDLFGGGGHGGAWAKRQHSNRLIAFVYTGRLKAACCSDGLCPVVYRVIN